MDISSSIRISARDCASVDLAVTFITKLIQRIKSNDDAMLFSGSIADDGPRFETRSLFIDHARNFHGVEPVLTLLDVMESLEMNQFRVEINQIIQYFLAVFEISIIQQNSKMTLL